MELKFNNNTLVPTSPSGKYTADIAGSVSGWKFFENVKSSGGLTSSIKTQISLNAINKYMFVFTPAGVNREYATATAPVTDGAEFGYGTKPTRVFTIRQYGEAWNRPFINAFEPTTQLNTTIQSIEQITNGSKAVGAKVISLVNGETITDYIISHEDDTSTYNNSSLNFTFKGRFGILRLSEKSGVTKSTLYIGSGTNMIFNTRVLTANSDGSGYLGEQVLPVKLISFSAKAVNKGVELNWKTALEYNSKKFKLYHSSDGINFKSLVEINSLNTPSNYKYLHESPNNNTNYYKLIQTDFDNKQNNLGVRVVNYNVNLGKSVSIFPNPTNKLVNIQFNTNTNEKVRVQIISSFGKTLQEEYILVTSDKQKYILELNKNINAGMYIIQMSTPQKTIYTDKLIVR